jgi:hypothetical protein
MKFWRFALVALLLVAPAQAGDIVTRSFNEDVPEGRRVLTNVEHKAVVAEYLDPMNTGMGKSLSQLLWREVLSAISDQSGAGVILARPPGDERLVDLLKQDYHRAALRIAEHQEARMALWGALYEKNETLFISSYLSLVKATRSDRILVDIGRMSRRDHNTGEIELKLPRNKFNFRMVTRTREQLFHRPLMISRDTNIREEARRDATRLGAFEPGDVAQGVGMDGGWFEVRLPDGRLGYVTGSNVDLAPLSIRVDRSGINLRREPVVREDTVLRNTDVRGQFTVLEQRFSSRRLWYRIRHREDDAWIAASLTERVYSMPVVHFIAGLYRYFGGRYEDSRRDFQRFVDYPETRHSNVNLSVAFQYQALSSLLEGRSHRENLRYLEKARQETPLDSIPLKIEAMSLIGEPDAMQRIQLPLEEARKLDARSEDFRNFERALQAAARPVDT